MTSAPKQGTWRDRWVWWLLAALTVIAGWVAFDSWQDTNREDGRQRTDYSCAIDPDGPAC